MLNSTASPLSGLSALSGPPYFVDLHVNPGESVSIQLFDGNETILRGPATITMISQHTFPPIPMPVQVPPGHMIQQIVDENGQLRQIILSAHPNGNTNPSNAALMPPQQQQPFPYCCCCSYSCMGTAQTAPVPPPLPPPPPPQLRHNILAFPTPQTRRRISPMNRTFSPAGKRSAPTYLNNNSIGKSPVRHKLVSTTAGASVDGVSKVSFANISNTKHTTPSDSKPYELNGNRVLVGRVTQNENDCLSLSDPKHVINKTYNTISSKDMMDRGMNNKELIANNGSFVSAPRPAHPFSYTSLEEHKQLNHSIDKTNCSHFESSEKPSILLEINLSSNDSRVQNNISADIVEEEEEELEECDELSNECQNHLEIADNSVDNKANNKDNDKMADTSPTDQLLSLTHEESLTAISDDKSNDDLSEDYEQTFDRTSDRNNRNTLNDIQSKTSCISYVMQDNQNEDTIGIEISDPSLSHCQSLTNHFQTDSTDSINQTECQLNKTEDIDVEETDYSIELSSEENQTKESINIFTKLSDDESEEVNAKNRLVSDAVPVLQRSPKHLLPQLELLNLTYTSLTANTVKLKWTHSDGDHMYAKHFVVEMLLNNKASTGTDSNENESMVGVNGGNCRIVYQGHSNNCRISHLSSQQQYSFRVRTTSEEHLVVSNALTITTPEQQPISNKLTKKSRRELLHQQIQQQQHQIHQQQLLLQQQQLQQQSQSRTTDKTEPTISSDQRCAILLLLLFTLFALIVAVLIQQLLSDN
ncbi:unnamed protein product [Medioppia subpectinata]|uniref:Fibronectin type-III domain-containing protein n=1 Tax=Medioppia subpectinata TaxID=1979941 RepID=A0A7R9PXA6_9ACAR|nr:unnamed protein product [Medioppia subpectinata]CAG2103775.1 unnamed protein product [Medioppia subpectinata]